MDLSIRGILGHFCQDIETRVSVPLKGVKIKMFPVKILAFKIYIFILSKICNDCQIFKKSYFIIFIDV